MAIDKATDLAYDMLWFFDGQNWDPPMMGFSQIEKDMNILALKLPIALSFITDPNNRGTYQVQVWQGEVRNHMTELGFYNGNIPSRDDKYFAKELKKGLRKYSQAASGKPVSVFVCTDVGLATGPCKKLSTKTHDYTKVQCAYANEAQARGNKTAGGICIRVGLNEGLSVMWAKLRDEIKNRKVVSLQFLDHGAPDQQLIGGGRLTAQSDIPQDLASRFAKGAEITFYGCQIMKKDRMEVKQLSALATHVGTNLLVRGGSVVGFSTPVKCELNNMKVIEPKADDRVPFKIDPWNGPKVVDDIKRLIKNMRGKYAVKYARVIQEKPAEVETALLQTLEGYPDDYPDSGYYDA